MDPTFVPPNPLPLDVVIAVQVSPTTQALLDAGLEYRAREWVDAATGPWQYVLIFLLAAVPLLEILVVIPIGVALGLDPALVAAVAVLGNLLPVYGIVLAYHRISSRLAARRGHEGSRRRARAKRIWNAYGLPGVAILAPIATGVHLAALIALSLGARKSATLAWMTAAIVAWAVAITVASVAGVSIVGELIYSNN